MRTDALQVQTQEPLFAFSVEQFCQRYSIGRSSTYEEIKAGRLRVKKVGSRTLIAQEEATRWFNALPQR
ncbi:MAG: DNA-binding protein [Rhabdaerophilum sp.]